jgi:hypothetical protein
MPGVLEDNVYIAFPQVVFTHAGVPDDVVYHVVKAVFDNFDLFQKWHPAFATLSKAQMSSANLFAPLHPGAVRYYNQLSPP